MNELFNQKINFFVKHVPSFSRKDLTIYYVYRKLAPYFQRDLDFFMASQERQLQIYEQGFEMQGENVVCQTICQYYGHVFRKLHIDFKIITTNNKLVPYFALLVSGDYGWFLIDPLKDLYRNQMGFQPNFFGVIPFGGTVRELYPYLISLDNNYILSLAKETNTLPFGNFLDVFFELLHQDIFQSSNGDFGLEKGANEISIIQAKLKFISDYLLNMGEVLGNYERRQYHSYLKTCFFNRPECNHIDIRITDDFQLSIVIYEDLERQHKVAEYLEFRDCDNEYRLKRVV